MRRPWPATEGQSTVPARRARSIAPAFRIRRYAGFIRSATGEPPVCRDNHVDVSQLNIEKDCKSATNSEPKNWSTWPSFDFESLGPMPVKISVTNPDIAATLRAELQSTADLIERNLPTPRQPLDRLGLAIKELQFLQGRPPRPATSRLPHGLFDLIACKRTLAHPAAPSLSTL
ncbi:MAG: flagellar hook-length control protein FliK [Gammaproteobacteria bacterium]